MITVKLLGGLGNQMFQAAYALALEERGHEVQLDKSSLIEGTHREYSLGYFGITADGVSNGRAIYEGDMRYNPAYLEPPPNATVVGYWQTEKYFSHIANKVRKTFDLGFRTRYVHTIAIHVRRKDYVGLEHFHGMPSLEYYREGVAYIRRETGHHCPVMVFSDDPEWCRENFPDFQVCNGQNKYDDLKLMSSCDYQVIANSSFSWWASWLGNQRLVIAPKQWFTEPSLNYSDIVPERWVKL